VIDLHCHVLPAVDDGPADVEGSLQLARGALTDGITTIAATPHVDFSHLHLDAARIADEVAALQSELDAAEVELTIVTGGEFQATRAIERRRIPAPQARPFAATEGGAIYSRTWVTRSPFRKLVSSNHYGPGGL
jgi:Capsular polysaccharide synthesis, CpsB/CapC